MNILHIVPTLDSGGAETLVAYLAISQKELGHDVSVFLLAGIRSDRARFLLTKLENVGVNVFGTSERNPRNMQNIFYLSRLLRQKKFDVGNCHLYAAEVVFCLASILLGKRYTRLACRTLHNADLYGTRSVLISDFLSFWFDLSIACGNAVEQAYKKTYKDKRSVTTIENGVLVPKLSLTEKQKIRHQYREMHKIGVNDFVVLSVGAFRGSSLADAQKAHDVVIDAFVEQFEHNDDAYLILIGGGGLLQEAKEYAGERCKGRIIFTGMLSDVSPFFAMADVFFMPSRWEGLPMTLLEASFMGLDIIASSIEPIKKIAVSSYWKFADVNNVKSFSKLLADKYRDRSSSYDEQFFMQLEECYSMIACSRKYLHVYGEY